MEDGGSSMHSISLTVRTGSCDNVPHAYPRSVLYLHAARRTCSTAQAVRAGWACAGLRVCYGRAGNEREEEEGSLPSSSCSTPWQGTCLSQLFFRAFLAQVQLYASLSSLPPDNLFPTISTSACPYYQSCPAHTASLRSSLPCIGLAECSAVQQCSMASTMPPSEVEVEAFSRDKLSIQDGVSRCAAQPKILC